MFIVKMADHDGNHRCLVEKNVPIAFILPGRWQDGAESLGIERPHNLFLLLRSLAVAVFCCYSLFALAYFSLRSFGVKTLCYYGRLVMRPFGVTALGCYGILLLKP